MKQIIDNDKMWASILKCIENGERFGKSIIEALRAQGLQYNSETNIIEEIKENDGTSAFNIEAGKWYMCVMPLQEVKGFDANNIYLSDEDGCITNNNGVSIHLAWGDYKLYFRPATEEELSHQEVTKKTEQELTEFEQALRLICNELGVSYSCKAALKSDAKELLSIARKQFIEEACEFLNTTQRGFILTEKDIEDFKKIMISEKYRYILRSIQDLRLR